MSSRAKGWLLAIALSVGLWVVAFVIAFEAQPSVEARPTIMGITRWSG